jgi:hypothetical protein
MLRRKDLDLRWFDVSSPLFRWCEHDAHCATYTRNDVLAPTLAGINLVESAGCFHRVSAGCRGRGES